MLYIGIDPGLSGAIGYLHVFEDGGEDAQAVDMPVAAYSQGVVKNAVDLPALAAELWAAGKGHESGACPAVVFMERVNAMPGQGVSSVFSLGMSYWGVAGVVAAIGLPLNLIAPATWKAYFKLPADKEFARGLASRLYPRVNLSKKKHHGRAEALLIARYARLTTKGG